MTSMKRWVFGSLAVLLAIGMLLPAGMFQPAWANSELHFGARLFFPLWDVRGNRQTYIVLTREALTDGNTISGPKEPTANQTYTVGFPFDNCRPRGDGFGNNPSPSGKGNTANVNRISLGGTGASPTFVDDVHFEYYGKTCINSDELIHMSCADIDLFVLDDTGTAPLTRPVFATVAFDGVGALDTHLVINGSLNPRNRKDENSLMGTAIISDVAEGWAAEYPAAAAKSTSCIICSALDGGTNVGYEPYPMEVYLPMVFADGASAPGGKLSNLLSLWSPNLFAGGSLPGGRSDVIIKYWDGREREFATSTSFHALVRTLGNPIQSQQDVPSSVVSTFNVANFTCGHTGGFGTLPYENDGRPRANGVADIGCPGGGADSADTEHKSDNFEQGPTLQTSNPIAWWRFQLVRDNQNLPNVPGNFRLVTDNSGRGLVGVVLTSTPGASFTGVGDALRLWHKDPCELAQSGDNFGPPHLRDASAFIIDAAVAALGGPNGVGGSAITIFNALSLENQALFCSLPELVKSCLATQGTTCLTTGTPGGFVNDLGVK